MRKNQKRNYIALAALFSLLIIQLSINVVQHYFQKDPVARSNSAFTVDANSQTVLSTQGARESLKIALAEDSALFEKAGYADPYKVLSYANDIEITPDQLGKIHGIVTNLTEQTKALIEKENQFTQQLSNKITSHSTTPFESKQIIEADEQVHVQIRFLLQSAYLSIADELSATQVKKYFEIVGTQN
ncbi:MAG: hypothetical protein WCP97_04335 [bacterium]